MSNNSEHFSVNKKGTVSLRESAILIVEARTKQRTGKSGDNYKAVASDWIESWDKVLKGEFTLEQLAAIIAAHVSLTKPSVSEGATAHVGQGEGV
jgi:hypothetical protein